MRFEKNEETVRPFRLWDAKESSWLPHRFYSDLHRAHIGALIEARWAKIGTCIEVIDVHKAKMKGQYLRRVNDLQFIGE